MPETFAEQLERVRSMTTLRAWMPSSLVDQSDTEALSAVLEQFDRMREVLEWYADEKNHEQDRQTLLSHVDCDGGEKAKEALEFYADGENWYPRYEKGQNPQREPIADDQGERARTALEGIGGGRIKVMEEVLRFYADPDNWPAIEADGGRRAKTALEGLK